MDLCLSPDHERFRAEVREFIASQLPQALARKVLHMKRLTKEDYLTWHRRLHSRGWSARPWPKEFGGPGWSYLEQHIFDREASVAGAPPPPPFGVGMVGPLLVAFGNPEQRANFLPRILSGEDWWCQGFSEPNAGSDLAALATTAERHGDCYIVNGQKTWNTLGQHADWMFCLVRTRPGVAAQVGTSFLLIPMTSPGVTVKPLRLIDGEHEVNEISLHGVRVPLSNRVGEENKGWSYAQQLLAQERSAIAEFGTCQRELGQLKSLASQERIGGRSLLADVRFRDRLAEIEIDLMALEYTALRLLSAGQPHAPLGPEVSVLKIRGAEIQQALTELRMRAIGQRALAFIPEALDEQWHGEPADADTWAAFSGQYFNRRKTTIFGGTNEIQRDIIARRILRL